ncbi:MAG: hypothetical protein WAR78_17255 [Ferruginibacter sp.]
MITLISWFVHVFWKKILDPRRSIVFFGLYIVVHLLSVLLLVFLFGFILNHYKEFFFKR